MLLKNLLYFSALFSSICIVSCIQNPITISNTDLKENLSKPSKVEQSPIPSPSVSIVLSEQIIISPNYSEAEMEHMNKLNKNHLYTSPRFDDSPGIESDSNEIIVMYKDNYFVRVDKKNNKIIENGKYDYSLLMNLLNEYKLQRVNDSSLGTQEEADAIEIRSTEYYKADIPNNGSLHYYEFPLGTNTKQLCKRLRELSFVLTAYPEPTLTIPERISYK